MNKKEDTSNGTQTFTAYGVRAASSGLWWGQITSQNNPSIPKDSTNATIHATGRINFRFPQNVPVAGSILIPVPGSRGNFSLKAFMPVSSLAGAAHRAPRGQPTQNSETNQNMIGMHKADIQQTLRVLANQPQNRPSRQRSSPREQQQPCQRSEVRALLAHQNFHGAHLHRRNRLRS